jgi:mannose-6-phosphate isomerase-like protein (cupin superfamily)
MSSTSPFETLNARDAFTVNAPDGSLVRILLKTDRGSAALFELKPGQTSLAVAHRTVEEIWTVISGKGQMWRKLGDSEEITELEKGTCVTILVGTAFQFRCLEESVENFVASAITMPPWPGEDEAYFVEGMWKAGV